MVVFLTNRRGIRNKRLHRRVKNRFQSDARFNSVQFRVTKPREPGPYRVVAQTNPQVFLNDDTYPISDAKIEVGFDAQGSTDDEFYWFNWVEPDRSFLLGWHQDDTHPEYGPVHLQVNESSHTIDHQSAEVIDAHPMAVVEARLEQLPEVIGVVEWQDRTVVGLKS